MTVAVLRRGGPIAALLVLFLSAAAAQDFPPLTGRVVDAADILSPETERRLSLRLSDWESESSDQIVVATVPDLQGYEIEDYGVELARAWGVGQEDGTDGLSLDNGVVLLIAPNERRVRIEVGYGLEGTVTDVLADTVIRTEMVPPLRDGDYDAAATAGVDGLLAILRGELTEAQARRQRAPDRPMAQGEGEGVRWPLILFWLVMVFVFLSNRRKRGREVMFDSDRRRRSDLDIVPWIIASQMNGRRGGWGGGFSSGGGFGGGFSGGGGGFGGGGASGSW